VADPQARQAAVASVEHACPRCGAPREPRQEYCVECGLRLPPTTGVIAALRRWWLRRFGWYPGDWVWTSLLGLVVAVAGAAVAIALTSHAAKGGTTIIAQPPSTPTTAPVTTTTAATTTVKLPTPPEPTTTTKGAPTTTAPAPTNGDMVWPAATSGWTVVLASSPISEGRATAAATAKRAAHDGLTQVGVLDSSDWSSLHPGYYVVFSGIYTSSADAQYAVAKAMKSGFSLAYVRPIAH
jgi:cell division septation protein DedD